MNYDPDWVELDNVKMLSIASGSRQVIPLRENTQNNHYPFLNSQLDGLYGAASITVTATSSDLQAFCFGGKFMTGKFISYNFYELLCYT